MFDSEFHDVVLMVRDGAGDGGDAESYHTYPTLE